MPEFITRMEAELEELTERIFKLSKFIETPTFKYYVCFEKQGLMKEQLSVMIRYQGLLERRLRIELGEYNKAKRYNNG